MNSFKAYLKKEIKEGLRSYRFLTIAVVFIVFAISDPLLLKMLPTILASQMPEGMAELMKVNQPAAIQSYLGNLYQIILIVVVLSIMNIVAEEIKGKKIVLPYSKGLSIGGMILAKTLVYSIIIPISALIGILINYYYVGILFTEAPVAFESILRSGLLFFMFFMFLVSLTLFFSSIFRKGIVAAVATLVTCFLIFPLLANINALNRFIPYNLIQESSKLINSFESSITITLISVTAYIIALNIGAIFTIKSREIV